MELLLLNYVALFYLLLFYHVWKRWYFSSSVGGGRRSLKRLQRCAPQVLVRVARQQQQCQLFLEQCFQRRHWLHYAFCYYYGGHARHVTSWLVSAVTLYCLWNKVHASSESNCYLFSYVAFVSMATPYRCGPYIGMALAGTMPAFMRFCQLCPSHITTAEECYAYQRTYGCHACDRRGCWTRNPASPACAKPRASHPDGGWGDAVPHMREVRATCTAKGVNIHGSQDARWWQHPNHRGRVVFTLEDSKVNATGDFIMGEASGDQCNCLIDTLRQQLQLECDVRAVRQFVQDRHQTLVRGDYLELQYHWKDVIAGLAHVTGGDFVPRSYRIVCIDAMFVGNGDVEPPNPREGATTLYIARQDANHFVPLKKHDCVDNAESSSESGHESVPSSAHSERHASSDDDDEAQLEKDAAIAARALESMKSLEADLTNNSDDPAPPDRASDASSVNSGNESVDDDASTSGCESDATDVFHLQVEATPSWETLQDQHRRVAHILAAQMRRHPLVPAQPGDDTGSTSFTSVHSGLKLPASHCAFRGCCWTGKHKEDIEEHVVREHRAALLAAERQVFWDEGDRAPCYGSSGNLSRVSKKLTPSNRPLRHLFMGYYRQAIAEIERGVVRIAEDSGVKDLPHGAAVCQGVPVVGPSIDRRTFQHLRDVYNDSEIYSLICAVCAQRRTHTKHHNSAIRRRHLELFEPNHTERSAEHVLRIHVPQQYLRNLCRKTFLHCFVRPGTPLYDADFLQPMEPDEEVSPNILLPEAHTEHPEKAWDLRRLYKCTTGNIWDLLCCPEDIKSTEQCDHTNERGYDAAHIVCQHCLVPVCLECYDFISRPPLYASPMALANDNVIGYTYETILKHKVTWIEAAAAQPAWTTMMCFYIEGDHGHLLEETMFQSSFMTVVRGNVHSYHLPWEKILDSLNRSTSDAKLCLLPHDPEHLAHMVQLQLKVGTVDMAKHIKQIRLRAHVVLELGYELINAGHEAYIKASKSGRLKDFTARMKTAKDALKRRVQQRYPTCFTPEGEVPPAVLRKIEERQASQKPKKSLIQDKHATLPEPAAPVEDVFEGQRPQSLVEERVSDAGMDVAAQRTEILRQYTPLGVNVDANYVKQFHSLYPSQVFPFTFPYMVGGPEYFSRSEDSRRAYTFDFTGAYYDQFGLGSLPACAKVDSRLWTAGIARRVEAQLQADWCLIPALRNLDFRHAMYAGSSLKFQAKVETEDALREQARQFCEAAKNLYQHHLWHGYQLTRTGRKQYINGDITKLPFAHGLTEVEKQLLRNLRYKASTLSGSQELRLQMGHCLTGANIVYGTGLLWDLI